MSRSPSLRSILRSFSVNWNKYLMELTGIVTSFPFLMFKILHIQSVLCEINRNHYIAHYLDRSIRRYLCALRDPRFG